jgi:phosphatidylcholine synthase
MNAPDPSPAQNQPSPSKPPDSVLMVGLAALVHVFTALGVVCGLLALLAVLDGRFVAGFIWLGVALIIDGLDGTLARALAVTRRAARISGTTLDLVVDYVTYVFVPVVAMLKAGLLVGHWGIMLASLALLSSLFHFSDTRNKADDHSFVGFPAVWNLVAFYLFAFQTGPVVTTLIVLACVALTFVPLRWAHPFRVTRFRAVTISVSVLGSIAAIWTLRSGFPADVGAKILLAVAALYFCGMAIFQPAVPVTPCDDR